MKRPLAPIEGNGIRLRLLEERDLETTLAWRNRDEIRRWFLNPGIIDRETHFGWFARYLDRDDDFVFIIETTGPGGRPIGQASLYDIDRETRRGEFGRLMIGDPGAAGKGYGRAATELLLRFAFAELDLEEIVLTVIAGNEPAIAIYRKSGFTPVSSDDKTIVMRLTRDAFEHAVGR